MVLDCADGTFGNVRPVVARRAKLEHNAKLLTLLAKHCADFIVKHEVPFVGGSWTRATHNVYIKIGVTIPESLGDAGSCSVGDWLHVDIVGIGIITQHKVLRVGTYRWYRKLSCQVHKLVGEKEFAGGLGTVDWDGICGWWASGGVLALSVAVKVSLGGG